MWVAREISEGHGAQIGRVERWEVGVTAEKQEGCIKVGQGETEWTGVEADNAWGTRRREDGEETMTVVGSLPTQGSALPRRGRQVGFDLDEIEIGHQWPAAVLTFASPCAGEKEEKSWGCCGARGT